MKNLRSLVHRAGTASEEHPATVHLDSNFRDLYVYAYGFLTHMENVSV